MKKPRICAVLVVACFFLMYACQASATALVMGDVNSDNSIDNLDAALILQHAANWTVELNAGVADVNGDDSIDNLDAALILQHAANWDVSFAEPESNTMTYEEFMAMSAAEQLAFIESFADDNAFFTWYNTAKAEYDRANSGTEMNGGSIDMGDLIGGGN